MRTFDTPYDTAFWRSQPRIDSYLFLIKSNTSSTTPTTSSFTAKIFEYEMGNESAYITTELTTEIKAFLLNASQARFCVLHSAQKPNEIDSAAWYTPAYFINNIDIFDSRTKIKLSGRPLPIIADWSSPITVSAVNPFTTVFDNLLAGASSTYAPDGFTKDVLSSQYWHTYNMETSGNITLYDMNDLVGLVKRKYLAQPFARSFDGANHKVLFVNKKPSLTSVGFDYIGKLQLISDSSNRNIRLFYTDQFGVTTDTIYGTKSHDLGFIPSTANATEMSAMTGIQVPVFKIYDCFDPRHENGDLLEITTPLVQNTPSYTIGAYITVTERFKNGQYLETIIETPTLPDGIAASSVVKSNSRNTAIANVIDTSKFNSILDATDNSLQKALDKLDDHDHSGVATTEGVQDIVGAMVSSNTETGIAVTYDDTNGKLNFDAQTAGDTRYAPIAKGVTNGDSHDHNGGDGGTIAYSSLSGRPTAETNSNDIFRVDNPGGVSLWTGTISGAPSGTSVTVSAPTSGTEAVLVPTSTSQLAKMRLYNLTRGTSALISNYNTATNVITLTANAPAAWANGDSLTIVSQTVSGGGFNWIDLEITSGPTSKSSLFVLCTIQPGAIGDALRVHPFETFGAGKVQPVIGTVVGITNNLTPLLKIVSNVFSIAWTTSTSIVVIRETGYLE